jgi:hypothetical protein
VFLHGASRRFDQFSYRYRRYVPGAIDVLAVLTALQNGITLQGGYSERDQRRRCCLSSIIIPDCKRCCCRGALSLEFLNAIVVRWQRHKLCLAIQRITEDDVSNYSRLYCRS